MHPMQDPDETFSGNVQRLVAAAALALLVASSAIGVWLGTLLLWPGLGKAAGPLTYGRWVPAHLDLQLFGWCSLPLIGVLILRMLPASARWLGAVRVALAAWVGALVAGTVSWLTGDTTGKVFLDWRGPAATAFTIAQLVLWAVLAAGWLARGSAGGDRTVRRATDAFVLLCLLGVPFALRIASEPAVYPPVNPHSGGATGHSLLASSLGVVGLALVLPTLLGRPSRRQLTQETVTMAAIFAANWVVYLYIHHGNVSNHDPEQVAGLGTLLLWPPLLVWWFRLFHWEPAQRRWLITTGVWCALLVLDGFVIFLPGVLEGAKFTNSLVAHAHLAMAGLLTALNMVLLISLAPRTRLALALDAAKPWLYWNAACAVMVVALTWVGWHEGHSVSTGTDTTAVVSAGYAVRLAAGIAMLAAAASWLRAAVVQPAARTSRVTSISLCHGARPAPFELFSVLAGLMDATTGLLLLCAPRFTLRLFGASIPIGGDDIFVRFVGAFVAGVGVSYLWGLAAAQRNIRARRLAGVLGATTVIRFSVAAFTVLAVAVGRLSPPWLVVGASDAVVAVFQTWLMRGHRLEADA